MGRLELKNASIFKLCPTRTTIIHRRDHNEPDVFLCHVPRVLIRDENRLEIPEASREIIHLIRLRDFVIDANEESRHEEIDVEDGWVTNRVRDGQVQQELGPELRKGFRMPVKENLV